MLDRSRLLGGAAALGALAAASSASAQELRFMCYADGNECEVLEGILDGFEAENEGVTVAVDVVPYSAILESLPVQLAAGEGPDMARVTDLGGLNEYYLDLTPYVDAEAWTENFGAFLDWYRGGPDDDGIYGVHNQLAVTGAYVNATLFEQAGVEIPDENADWDAWAEATSAVAEATGTPFAMAMDRSGHRIAGPAISYGAQYFDENGEPILVDDGFRGFVEKFVGWNQDGTMAIDVWAGSGGASYRDAAQEFVNGQLVYYYSGSWQVARFEEEIGDAFDWRVVGSPCGPGGCSGMPGGAGIVGFSQTEHPELVAKALDYLASAESYGAFSAQTLNVPGHAEVIASGVEYEGVSDGAAEAMASWAAQVPKLSPIAIEYQGYKNNRAMFNITVQRVTQAIVGELTLDEAMERAKEDLAEAMAAAE